jgi:hypothetical protein
LATDAEGGAVRERSVVRETSVVREKHDEKHDEKYGDKAGCGQLDQDGPRVRRMR